MRDVDLSHIFPLEPLWRALPPKFRTAALVCFVLGAWALGAFIDGVTL
jgi:hypothetical protein